MTTDQRTDAADQGSDQAQDQATDLYTILQTYAARPQLQPGEDRVGFGLVALRYMLAAPVAIFGLHTDQELEAIKYAARYALVSREISPVAVERITRVQLDIHDVLTQRAAERETAETAAALRPQPPAARPPQGSQGNDGGTKVPTHPTPPRPPQPDAVRIPTPTPPAVDRPKQPIF